jgi:hypothetical protein
MGSSVKRSVVVKSRIVNNGRFLISERGTLKDSGVMESRVKRGSIERKIVIERSVFQTSNVDKRTRDLKWNVKGSNIKRRVVNMSSDESGIRRSNVEWSILEMSDVVRRSRGLRRNVTGSNIEPSVLDRRSVRRSVIIRRSNIG